MKQIVFLLFTLSGIYSAAAQNDVVTGIWRNAKATDTIADAAKTNAIKKDSGSLKKIASAKLLTNPVKNKLQISVNNFDAGMAQLLILDTRSHILRNDSRMIYSDSELITVMFSLPAGIYVIMLKQKGRSVSKKFMVAP